MRQRLAYTCAVVGILALTGCSGGTSATEPSSTSANAVSVTPTPSPSAVLTFWERSEPDTLGAFNATTTVVLEKTSTSAKLAAFQDGFMTYCFSGNESGSSGAATIYSGIRVYSDKAAGGRSPRPTKVALFDDGVKLTFGEEGYFDMPTRFKTAPTPTSTSVYESAMKTCGADGGVSPQPSQVISLTKALNQAWPAFTAAQRLQLCQDPTPLFEQIQAKTPSIPLSRAEYDAWVQARC